jgi:hydroxyacylglutathione hydrolase
MLLERYYDDSLAQASYLIGCERTREAVIVDPNRDIDRYTRAAAAHRMRIRYVTETHIHADYLSGSRDLARASGAQLLLSGHGGADWDYAFAADAGARLLRDGESITVGKIRIDVLHTPGHTPEHICFLVTDTATSDRAMGMVTGDFIFVGDVGRPDLLERSANVQGSMASAARQLYDSLTRTRDMPDYLQLWPGHGAGSACGKSLGAMPQTTLGYERLVNPAFQQETEASFVAWVLADQPEPPNYFAVMKRLNREGPPVRPAWDSFRQVDAAAVETALDKDQWVVDVRASAEFAQMHVPGSINIPASKSLPTYAGTVLSYDRPVIVVAKTREQAQSVIAQFALIGVDNVAGFATLDVLQQIKSEGRRLGTTRTIDPAGLVSKLDAGGARVIDVRGTSEWNDGHLPQATHIYLGELEQRTASSRRDEPIVVHCETGTRASIAASLLMARGFSDVTVLSGGYDAWRKAGLPVVSGQRSR